MALNFVSKGTRQNLIVFVHGFIGGADTWIRTDNKKSLLDYLIQDKKVAAKFDFAVFDYFTKISDLKSRAKFWLGFLFGTGARMRKNIPVGEIAQLLESEIKYKCEQYKNIVLIAHSMGGLVSKSYILNQINNGMVSPVKLYISLAVPHLGSDLATFGKLVVKNPQIVDLAPLTGFIQVLNQSWINKAQMLPETVYIQGKNDQVVPATSSISYDVREREAIYSDDDHFSIVRPEREDDVVVMATKKWCLSIN